MGKTFRKDQTGETYRDHKHNSKPDSDFKHYNKAQRKAKERDAMRHLDENELIPEFPKHDVWDWN